MTSEQSVAVEKFIHVLYNAFREFDNNERAFCCGLVSSVEPISEHALSVVFEALEELR